MQQDDGDKRIPTVDGRNLTDRELELAHKRRAALAPLLGVQHCSATDIGRAAELIGCSPRTVWNLLKRYRLSLQLVDLVPQPNRRTTGKTFIEPKAEAIMAEVIETFHLSKMRPTIVQTVAEVRRRCVEASLAPPTHGTVRRRIKKIPDHDIVASREGRKAARYRYRAIQGQTPKTAMPLERVQIDHTTVDLVVVDEIYREPLRRPYITLAIDEYSRAVLGFYLSLDAPSATSVGLCLVHAVLPKEEWSGRLGLQFEWPMHGRPHKLYVDNGSDFHSEAVERGCAAWGIEIEYRPPGMPHFGGVVERMIGTAMRALRTLPGSTGASIRERGERDPAKDASMTLAELERYFATFFAGEYHRKLHSHHGLTPLTKWKQGIFGKDTTPGCGVPPPITDPQRFLIDFLPLARRRVSPQGIAWGRVHYMDDVLRPYIANEPKELFIVRRDPRDISSIWFLAPDDQRYYQVRSRDIARPSASLWELEDARRRLKAEGRRDYDESALFRAIEAQRAIVAAAAKSKSEARRARLAQERTRSYARNKDLSTPTAIEAQPSETPWHHSDAPDLDGNGVFEIEQ